MAGVAVQNSEIKNLEENFPRNPTQGWNEVLEENRHLKEELEAAKAHVIENGRARNGKPRRSKGRSRRRSNSQ